MYINKNTKKILFVFLLCNFIVHILSVYHNFQCSRLCCSRRTINVLSLPFKELCKYRAMKASRLLHVSYYIFFDGFVVSASILTSEPMVLLLLRLKKTSNDMIACRLDRREKTFRRTTAFYDNKRSMKRGRFIN